MVKINDPRGDTAAIAMRSLRADNVYKTIKKMIKKCKDFDEDKLDLEKTDINFYNNFINCDESIKQELIFLWEEVGNLYEQMEEENKENEENEEQEKQEEVQQNKNNNEINDKILLNLDSINIPKPPKRLYVMGP